MCICFTYSAGGIAYSNGFFGAGTGPIYLDDVACTSSASQLLECSSRPILTHNCLHSADAGVGCEGTYTHTDAQYLYMCMCVCVCVYLVLLCIYLYNPACDTSIFCNGNA